MQELTTKPDASAFRLMGPINTDVGEPKSLQELLDAKLLNELPRDPIDDLSLRYDPSRRLLWSIGLDGQDNGGV